MNPKEDEWMKKSFERLRGSVPDPVRDTIERTLNELDFQPPRRVRRPTKIRAAKAIVLATGTFLILACLLFAESNTFADTLKPWLRSIFMNMGDRGLSVTETKGDLPILAEATDQGYTLRIHEVVFDGLRLTFSYSLNAVAGFQKSQTVSPSFQLDPEFKASLPPVLMSDSGGSWEDGKVGIVNYYFNGNIPDRFMLKMRVPQLAITDTGAVSSDLPGQVLSGNWNFALQVEKKGSVKASDYGDDYLKTSEGVTFQAINARSAPRSSEWNLRLEYPAKWDEANVYNEKYRYGLKFKILAGPEQEELIIVTQSSKGGIMDRTLPREQWVRRSDYVLFTEPVPEQSTSVTIIPVLMKFPLDENQSYTEQQIDSLTIELPLPDEMPDSTS
ncbi:DUF4179 domain-containing protein [Fontibacillus sp. BL9]|uniref:DUF4179 domain-containing protein n=1 Tax=Fontibacillus sp. BL9 TaxID=3389971 RepID=UPI0039794BF2